MRHAFSVQYDGVARVLITKVRVAIPEIPGDSKNTTQLRGDERHNARGSYPPVGSTICYNRIMKKCYNCREETEDHLVLCPDCQNKEIKSTSTYIIFNKI